jgi:hypothetical protein
MGLSKITGTTFFIRFLRSDSFWSKANPSNLLKLRAGNGMIGYSAVIQALGAINTFGANKSASDFRGVSMRGEQYWNASSALWSKPVDSWSECSNSEDPGGCTKPPKCSDYIKQVRVSTRPVASCQQVNANCEKNGIIVVLAEVELDWHSWG